MRTTKIVQKQSQNKVQNTCSDQMRGHLCVASFGKILLEWSEGSDSQTSKLHPFVTPILGKIFWGRLWKKGSFPVCYQGFSEHVKSFFCPFLSGTVCTCVSWTAAPVLSLASPFFPPSGLWHMNRTHTSPRWQSQVGMQNLFLTQGYFKKLQKYI